MAIAPYLVYADASAAIEFLCTAFGFRVAFRTDTPDGSVGHAELALGDGRVMLSSEWPDASLCSPAALPGLHAQVWCEVDDVDAHYAAARDAGAVVIGPPDDAHGHRSYRAIDPEGHRWLFAGPAR